MPRTQPDWITVHGTYVWSTDPGRTEILPADLRRHSAYLMRYHGGIPVSVLRHSFLVALLLWLDGHPQEVVSGGAGHDLHEVYMGELASGVKRYLPDFKAREARWEYRVWDVLGLDALRRPSVARRVRWADRLAVWFEMDWHGHAGRDEVAVRWSYWSGEVDGPTWRQRLVQVLALGGYPGGDRLAWWAICRWLPRLKT